ncbi:hypothetical protein DIPPA_08803 [Diplonema papillatum]|nr:hypothetical protein DIPPA_08803 [Diplonema papillatum]
MDRTFRPEKSLKGEGKSYKTEGERPIPSTSRAKEEKENMHLGQTVVLLLSVATCVFGVEKKLSEDVRQEDSAPADAAPADAAPADAAPADAAPADAAPADAAPADAAPADSAPDDAEAPFDLETESPAPGTLEPAAPFDLETESPAPGKPEPVSTEAPFGLETDSPAPGTTEPAATEAPFPHALPPDNDDVPTDAGESPFDECNTTATYSTCTSQCEQQVSDGCGSSRVANCTTGDCVSVGYYLVLSDSGRFFDLALFDAELFMQRLSDALSDRISFVRAVLTYYCLVPNSRINSGITDVDKTSNRCRALNVQASAREASVLQEVCTTSASVCKFFLLRVLFRNHQQPSPYLV